MPVRFRKSAVEIVKYNSCKPILARVIEILSLLTKKCSHNDDSWIEKHTVKNLRQFFLPLLAEILSNSEPLKGKVWIN